MTEKVRLWEHGPVEHEVREGIAPEGLGVLVVGHVLCAAGTPDQGEDDWQAPAAGLREIGDTPCVGDHRPYGQ